MSNSESITGDDLRERLELIYSRYNRKRFIDPDPLLFLYRYRLDRDREIAGLVAACFAYGRISCIMDTVSGILEKLGPSPHEYILSRTQRDMVTDFKGFRYRFAGETHLIALLCGIREVLETFSTLENCFSEGSTGGKDTVTKGLSFLCRRIDRQGRAGHLLADPEKGSACKRGHLFLRWMVRKDRVDPGVWKKSDPAKLIVPLDTHMYRTGVMLGFTRRKALDFRTAHEITDGFREVSNEDPVKYDFSLTRFGIRRDPGMETLHEAFGV